ncbi:MAG: hypothetical protein G01um10143_180 [Parcubacteria group bacterium Gr01-1014_3]|nr:MAG: hypothetical protein G01um10143_180 [Parcubacteria group bacterium Gr01-1014_3]
MKIVYLNHDFHPNTGAGRFGRALISGIKLACPDLDLQLLSSEADPDSQFPSRSLLPSNRFRLLLTFSKIRAIIKNGDLIHALDGWPYGFIAALASFGLKKRLIITAIGTGAVKPLYSPIKRALLGWAYRRADQLTAISNNTKREILKIFPDLKIEVINHGVDNDKFQISNFKAQTNSEFQKLKPYILSVGALKKRKGLEYSIRAFAEISKNFPSLRYLIFGKGDEYKNLRSLSESLGVSNRVEFLSYALNRHISDEELVDLYKNAELFILLPQDFKKDIEGFGLVFLEAAAAGLPVIGASGTSAEDAILDNQNGFLVDGGNPKVVAEAISKILNFPETKLRFQKKSIEFARSMDWKNKVQQYLKLY